MLYVWQEFFSSAVEPVVVAADCMELPFKDLVAVWEVAVAPRQKQEDWQWITMIPSVVASDWQWHTHHHHNPVSTS